MGRARIRHRLILLVALSALPRQVRAQWGGNGNGICIAAGDQGLPATAGDAAGGAFIVWEDNRPGSNGTDLYLQRITASGAPAAGWSANGNPLCVAANEQRSAAIVGRFALAMARTRLDRPRAAAVSNSSRGIAPM